MLRVVTALILTLIVILSCKSAKQIPDQVSREQVIRYINLNALYISIIQMNPEFGMIEQKRKRIVADIVKIQELILRNDKNRESLYNRLKIKRDDLQKADSKISVLKSKAYTMINRAVKKLSGIGNIDFVFNIGDELIYSRKKYDITEDVLREIIKTIRRYSPVSR